ncbi:hypothetical protein ABZ330_36125 [Streptomyces sp. NPDC006172]|uniref:hypothetical protein n=1 Tax=Streptomyces sp. NPDC006172 TaxID=3154470 RepID=UPI0033C1797E
MNDEVQVPADASVPEVDEVLAGALTAQGEAGVRALGLLRDARRALTGTEFVRPAEVAAACVRSAADALLGLPGAPVTVGLKPAAAGLLAAVDAFPAPATPCLTAVAEASPAAEPTATADSAEPAADAHAAAGRACAPDVAGTPQVPSGQTLAWERVRSAADVLRTELNRPGRYHQARARGIVERLMKVELGAAQETALNVWGTVYGVASGILHGRTADTGEAARLYTDVLGAARELLVPLTHRAARVLELVALERPGAAEARELAGWADPRAEAYFFRSGPATVWLTVLQEHAPHLLMPDTAAGGRWPAAVFLEHVAGADPDAARAWLAAPAGEGGAGVSRAQHLAAAGRFALDALLRLAVRRRDVVDGGQVRAVLAAAGVRHDGGAAAGATLRLAARWARNFFPREERTGEWILVVEELLAGAVEDKHAGHLALQSVVERAAAEAEAAGRPDGDVAEEIAVGAAGDGGAVIGWAGERVWPWVDEEEMWGLIAQKGAARLPDHEAAELVRELTGIAYPPGGGAAHPNVAAIRAVLAKLLARDIELTPEASRPVVFGADLYRVHVGDPAAFGGPQLARAVLSVAWQDAEAGVPLAQRTRQFRRLAGADPTLHTRLLAAHLTHQLPTTEVGKQEWWQQALALVPQLLSGDPVPEPARLVNLVLRTCPPEHAEQLQADVRTALGEPPAADLVAEVLPVGAEQAHGRLEPLASWLRVWDWSRVLPAAVLAGWEPVLDAARRLQPVPSDPVKAGTAVDAEDLEYMEDLERMAAEWGPVATAAALAGDSDAGDDGYAMVLHNLVIADPVAWTADVPAVLTALERPELSAFYLAAAGSAAYHPDAFPGGKITVAVTAALDLRSALGTPSPATGQTAVGGQSTAALFLDQAVFDLLTVAWRTDTDVLEEDLQAALSQLQALAATLTRLEGAGPAGHTQGGDAAGDVAGTPDPRLVVEAAAEPGAAAADGAGDRTGRTLLTSDPQGRALECLLEYAFHRARTTGGMPPEVLETVAGVLAVHSDQEAVATAIGMYLPVLHRYAPAFAAAHRTPLYSLVPGRPSPAAAWLRCGAPDRQLLAALDRSELLAALRADVPGAAEQVAHALLDDPALLGDQAAFWTHLAAGTAGVAAACRLLESIASQTPHPVADGPLPPALAVRVDAAVQAWRAALAAGLPAGALAGAGAFATAAVDDAVWLELTRASAEHSPALADADLVAHRAASHPGREDALLLAALLLTHPAGTWQDEPVRRHARTLLDAAAARPHTERPAAFLELRTALVNAGDVDAARI